MKAKNVSKGDWIKVSGKPVRVTSAEEGRKGGRVVWEISYQGGSMSGMLRPGPNAQVAHLAGKR